MTAFLNIDLYDLYNSQFTLSILIDNSYSLCEEDSKNQINKQQCDLGRIIEKLWRRSEIDN